MKRFALTLFATMATLIALFAQVPEGINYQAIARDGNGTALANQNIDVRFSIREGNPGGSVVFEEVHLSSTNDFGLFTLLLGQGNPQNGTFDALNWGTNSFFLQVEIDAGNGYVDLGTTQMMSVPYALYAKEAGNAGKDYTAGSGIDITGNTITNMGDLDPSDDMLKGEAAGGDLTGTYPSPVVGAIQGNPVSNDPPSAGEVLKWDGAQWKPDADNTGGGGNSVWSLQGNDAYYANGKVGVGTNSPNKELEVQGTVRVANQTDGFDLHVNNDGELEIGAEGALTPAITVNDDDDYMGVFGNTPVTANTSFDIHSAANGTSYGGMFVNTDGATAKPFYGYATAGGAKAWTYYDGTTEQLRIHNSGDHMVITKTGNVGIGRTNPMRELEVEGIMRLANNNELFDIGVNANGQFEILPNGTATAAVTVDDNNNYVGLFGNIPVTVNSGFDLHSPATGTNYGGMFVNTAGTDAKPFYGYGTGGASKAWTYYDGATGNWIVNNSGSHLTVTDEGKVGIGTTSPGSASLHVQHGGGYHNYIAQFEATKTDNFHRILELSAPSGTPGHRTGLSIKLGSITYASIDMDGAAQMKNIRLHGWTTSPEKDRIYGNSMPLGYASVHSNGTMPSLSDYGFTSVNKTGTGTYTFSLLNGFEFEPAVMVTPYDASGGEMATYRFDMNLQTITVKITDHAGNPVDSNFSIVVFGKAKMQ